MEYRKNCTIIGSFNCSTRKITCKINAQKTIMDRDYYSFYTSFN